MEPLGEVVGGFDEEVLDALEAFHLISRQASYQPVNLARILEWQDTDAAFTRRWVDGSQSPGHSLVKAANDSSDRDSLSNTPDWASNREAFAY